MSIKPRQYTLSSATKIPLRNDAQYACKMTWKFIILPTPTSTKRSSPKQRRIVFFLLHQVRAQLLASWYYQKITGGGGVAGKANSRCITMQFPHFHFNWHEPGSSVGIATGYGRDGPGIGSRWGARFSAPVQTGPGVQPPSCTMGTGTLPGVKSGRGVTLTPHTF